MKTIEHCSSALRRTAVLTALAALSGATSFGAIIDLGTFTVSGSSPSGTGSSVAGSAHFEQISSSQLKITLENTYAGATANIGDTIYGLYFKGATITTLVSAIAPTGEKTWQFPGGNGVAATSTTLASDLNIANSGANWQNSTAAAGYSGVSALGSGNQAYGLVSSGFLGAESGGLKNANHNPYVQDTAVFFLNTSSIGTITDVRFAFGTGGGLSSNSQATPVPEAHFAWGGVLILIPIARRMINSRRAKAA